MQLPRLLATAVVMCVLCTGAPAQEKVDLKMLLGVWEVTKADATLQGAVFEFAKDGILRLTVMRDGKDVTFDMTYTIEDDKLTTVIKGSKGRPVTIKKLTDKMLVWEDRGNTIELSRKK